MEQIITLANGKTSDFFQTGVIGVFNTQVRNQPPPPLFGKQSEHIVYSLKNIRLKRR